MTRSQSTTQKAYQQLTFGERGQIEALRSEGRSLSYIALQLGRNKSTISRELKRGTTTQLVAGYREVQVYFADTGQARSESLRKNVQRPTRFVKCPDFYHQLAIALKQRPRVHSVDSFVHYYRRKNPDQPCPSTPTVYRDINRAVFEVRNIDLPQKLRRHVKSQAPSHTRKNVRVLGTSIEKRPDSVDERAMFGHWEGDLVKGTRVDREPALMTLTERRTRFEIILKISDYHAETCKNALQSILDQYGTANFKTITFDNGSEFSMLPEVAGPTIYYAHPYSPWERGSNENMNGLIREFIPKHHSLHEFEEDYIKDVQDALNNRPRRLLEYYSPAELTSKFLNT